MRMKLNWTWVMAILGIIMFVAEMFTVGMSILIPRLGWGYPLTFFILAMVSLECLLFVRYESHVGRWYENITNIGKGRTNKMENPIKAIKGLIKPKKEELILPEGWGEQVPVEEKQESAPLAVEPIFHYANPSKQRRFGFRLPYRVKRIVAFILLLICVVLTYNTVALGKIDSIALIYFIPKTAMILYYLRRTQPNIATMTHLLDNIEKERVA